LKRRLCRKGAERSGTKGGKKGEDQKREKKTTGLVSKKGGGPKLELRNSPQPMTNLTGKRRDSGKSRNRKRIG